MAKILITGGTGLLGKSISKLLVDRNHTPVWLSRSEGVEGKIVKYKWNPNNGVLNPKAFEDVSYIIHLAGAGVMDHRWDKKYRQTILDSRVKSTELLFNTIDKNNIKIKSIAGASATGYYGIEITEKIFVETDAPGNDFLAVICREWEKSYLPFKNAGIRTNVLRLGVVLSHDGGAFDKLVQPARFGAKVTFGSGKQYFPWISITDAAEMFLYVLMNENIQGTFNSVSSVPITNEEFMNVLTGKKGKKILSVRIPEWVLKTAIGEGATTLTRGVKVNNEKIKNAGFNFQFDNLSECLDNL